MDKNINNDKDIEKIVSETFQNPDVLSFIVKQIKDQIEKEQKKVEQKKVEDNKITDKINKIQSKADTYLSNNNYLKDYVDNRDKYMNVFNDVANNLSKYEFKKEDSTDKTNSILDKLGITHHEDGSVTIPINKEISNNVQSNYTHFGWEKSSNNDKILGYLYFDNKGKVDFDKVLDVYSTLSLYQDDLTNWEYFDKDYTFPNSPISYSLDNYVYEFEPKESKDIDSNEANIISYIYIKPDDDLNMISVYMINCNTKTNKIYDFTRLIYTPCDNCSEASKDNFYYHLEKLITSNNNHIENRFEDYCYTYINQYKIQTIIDGVEEIICTDPNDVYKAIQDGIFKIIEEKKKEIPYKDEESNKSEDTSMSFVSDRGKIMDQAFDFLKDHFDCDKEEFTDEDCPNDYVEDICKKCEFNEECKEEYKKEEQEYDAYLEKLLNRHEIWDDDVWWEKIFDFFQGDSEDTFIKANDDFIIYMSFKNKIGKNIEGSELYSTYKIDKNNLTITIIEADPSEGFDVSWVGKLSMMINPIIDSDDKYEKILSYKNMYPLISDLTVKMCENVEIDPHKDIYYVKNKNNFTHNDLYKAVTDIILDCINYFYHNITDNNK